MRKTIIRLLNETYNPGEDPNGNMSYAQGIRFGDNLYVAHDGRVYLMISENNYKWQKGNKIINSSFGQRAVNYRNSIKS